MMSSRHANPAAVGQQKAKTAVVLEERELNSLSVLRSLRVISLAMLAHSKQVEKESGLSSALLWIMRELANRPGMRVSELAHALMIHQSTCSNVLDKLQKKELVYRDRSGPDHRVVRLFLTDKGRKLLAKAPAPHRGLVAETLDRLPADVLHSMEEGLRQLVTGMEKGVREKDLMPLDV
jgi:DNA-binding MarR family transcriptional regulator